MIHRSFPQFTGRLPIVVVLLGLLLAVDVRADEPADAEATGPAENVTVGVYVNQIHAFSLKDNTFTADFYVWFRWKDPELKPYSTFAIVDGRIESASEATVKELPGGELHAYTRVVATVTKFFDVRAFPFDNHELPIVIEEENDETHAIRYVADARNSATSPNLRLPGWNFQGMDVSSGEAEYRSNFGDTSLPTGNESRYGRLKASVLFTRDGMTYFTKLFFGLFVCVLLSMVACYIRPINVDPRFGVSVGALFGAVASQYVVAGALPETNVLTLADKLHVIAYITIISSVLESTVCLWLWEHDRAQISRRIDHVFRVMSPILYFAATFFVVRSA